jgi:hypothetical protein
LEKGVRCQADHFLAIVQLSNSQAAWQSYWPATAKASQLIPGSVSAKSSWKKLECGMGM